MGFNEAKYKKVYIGDKSGKARLLYAPNGAYRVSATGLSVAREDLAATTIGGYALFGGGLDNEGKHNTVDIYDASLTRTTATNPLSAPRYSLAATTVGNYALFGGGFSNSNSYTDIVDAYDSSLTRSNPTALSASRESLAATTIGSCALFGGGY